MLFLSYYQPYNNDVHLLVKDPKVIEFWEHWDTDSFEDVSYIQ